MTISPVFLVGAQRSGSTLLRVMLDAHPRIAFQRHGEIDYGLRCMRLGDRLPTDLSGYYAMLHSDYHFQKSGLVLDRSLPLDRLLRNFWDQATESMSECINMGTVHSNFNCIPAIFPQARYLYLYRDGRDVARSRVSYDWAGSFWSGIEPWIKAEVQWREMKEGLAQDSYLEVRFETLIDRPEETLTGICRFLGVSYTTKIFDYTRTSNYKAPDPRFVYRWRSEASETEIRAAEARAAEYLVARGYELSGLPSLEVNRWMARRFRRQGLWKRRLRRIRRVGIVNSVLEMITRRLRLSGLHTRIALSIDTKRQDSVI